MKFNYDLFLGVLLLTGCMLTTGCARSDNAIDRQKVVFRHNPRVNGLDSLSSLSVGNGDFACTVDITGLQTFPEQYEKGVPLGTQSQWGWHSFPNTEGYKLEDVYKMYDFGRGKEEPYPVTFWEKGRKQDAVTYLRTNSHRLHLGVIGFETEAGPEDIASVNQTLDLWTGIISSRFMIKDKPVEVETVCHPDRDMVAAGITSPLFADKSLKIKIKFAYGTGNGSACDWDSPEKHQTVIVDQGENFVLFERTLDTTRYYVNVTWEGKASVEKKEEHYYLLSPQSSDFSFSALFTETKSDAPNEKYDLITQKSKAHWKDYWQNGGFIDLGENTDVRANELERRIILSQYLTAIQCTGKTPPQETGLTYNSWYGKFHLEMHWWHAAHFALWNRTPLLERSFDWYAKVAPKAKATAERQGFEGIRWMKMTDPTGDESPSAVGEFIIWQQPHLIYMTELFYRQKQSPEVIAKYKDLVFETAKCMASFATWDEANNRYVLKGLINASETLGNPEKNLNPPFELAYWHYGLSTAQKWRERAGLERDKKWDDIIRHLSSLASKDGLYLVAESEPETYSDGRLTQSHMDVLGVYGILPESPLFEKKNMQQTFDWVWDNW
ncbi:MAG: hypothetical protein LBT83_12305, partial [Tannerella sp.]|nr:hypothetical protein [Tannerella sp.]